MEHQLVTANRLHDGEVVYLSVDGGWSEDLQDARLESDADAEQLATLTKLTERYCVVYQTLSNAPPMALEVKTAALETEA